MFDAELNCLGEQKTEAYHRKQAAIDALRSAGAQWHDAKFVIDSAREAKELERRQVEDTWQSYLKIRNMRGVHPDVLNRAWQDHEDAKNSLKIAQDDLKAARAYFEASKTEHNRALDEYRSARDEFGRLRDAFQDRLAIVQGQQARSLQEERRRIAREAGVPARYHDHMRIVTATDGYTHIYFGGVGKADGPGHGHYVLDDTGRLTYNRNPGDARGPHNFVTHHQPS